MFMSLHNFRDNLLEDIILGTELLWDGKNNLEKYYINRSLTKPEEMQRMSKSQKNELHRYQKRILYWSILLRQIIVFMKKSYTY